MRTLVTGGVRSGKSTHAEDLLAGREGVTYVAPGPQRDDADWAERVAAHRARRPQSWTTEETADVAAVLADADGDVLVDCLGTWLTAVCDELGWGRDDLVDAVGERVAELAAAVREARGDVVVVTNEVGMGIVPDHRSGRVFRDLLGTVNQRVAAECDHVVLVVAGRALHL